MKIIFFGSSEFARIILEDLLKKKISIDCVISTPDKPAGRGLKLKATPVKQFALTKSIEVLTPEDLRDPQFISELEKREADLFIVVSYGKIIPEVVFNLAKKLCCAIHPSLLPRWRGAAPIHRVLLNGEKVTGTTIFQVAKGVDCGPIILQKEIKVKEDDDIFSLSERLVHLSSNSLLEVIKLVENDRFTLTDQDDSKSTYAHKFTKADGHILWHEKTAKEIVNMIRALKVWPGTFFDYKGQAIKVIDAKKAETDKMLESSTILNITKEAIFVAAKSGVVEIDKLKPAGKKEMSARSFVCGYHLKVGDKLE